MYVAVKGGEQAIDNAHKLLAKKRRGDTAIPELSVAQIREQLSLAVDRRALRLCVVQRSLRRRKSLCDPAMSAPQLVYA